MVMSPIAIIAGISTSVQLALRAPKVFFYPNKAVNDAMLLASRRMANDVGSLQEQLKAHREVIDKLVEQVRVSEDLIEKHNEVLIQLGEATQQAVSDAEKLRVLAWWAIGISAAAGFNGGVILRLCLSSRAAGRQDIIRLSAESRYGRIREFGATHWGL